MRDDDFISYKTSDIHFGAYLCATGIEMIGTEKEDGGKKVVFVFKIPKRDFEHVKAAFFNGTGTVKALAFVGCLRNLKSICYA